VELIELAISEKLNGRQDMGVISNCETPIKNIILNGITTNSTDFKLTGRKVSKIILSNKKHLAIPLKVKQRYSL
jgi:hypothetical protein